MDEVIIKIQLGRRFDDWVDDVTIGSTVPGAETIVSFLSFTIIVS